MNASWFGFKVVLLFLSSSCLLLSNLQLLGELNMGVMRSDGNDGKPTLISVGLYFSTYSGFPIHSGVEFKYVMLFADEQNGIKHHLENQSDISDHVSCSLS